MSRLLQIDLTLISRPHWSKGEEVLSFKRHQCFSLFVCHPYRRCRWCQKGCFHRRCHRRRDVVFFVTRCQKSHEKKDNEKKLEPIFQLEMNEKLS